MTNEEWDRKVEFLLNQQAKFDTGMQELQAGMQELKEAQTISEQKIAKAADASALAIEAVTQLIDVTAHLTNTMYDGFRVVSDHMKHTDEKIDVLVDSQIELTALFERHIREDHKGRNCT